jgi:hypothetical protein
MLWWQHSQLLATKHLSVSTALHILTGEIIEELRNCVTDVQQQVPCAALVGGWDSVVILHYSVVTFISRYSNSETTLSGNLKCPTLSCNTNVTFQRPYTKTAVHQTALGH